MSRSQRRARSRAPKAQAAFARDLRTILQGLARAAALSSIGLAGCGSHHTPGELRQDVPAGESGTNVGRVAGGGAQMATAGSAAPAPMPPTGGQTPPRPPTGGTDHPPAPVDAGIAPTPNPPPEAPWVSLGCAADYRPPLLEGLKLTRDIDHAAVYSTHTPYLDQAVPGPQQVGRMYGSGTPCATASDATACQAAIDALLVPTPECGTTYECDPFLLVTAGDEVTRVGEGADLDALLGRVDTPSEAALVALLRADQQLACAQTSSQPLRGTEVREIADGYEVRTEWEACSAGLFSRTVRVSADGVAIEVASKRIGDSGCAIGRRPEGLRTQPPATAGTKLGAYFASAATLEAASVLAFERLARELTALDAPRELVACAARSALEEIGHARVVTALARRFGAEPGAHGLPPFAPRSALAIALENAVEGCVRETYGALVAHYQAETAADPGVRAVMSVLAEDETRHATLAWEVAHWLEPRLSADEQRAVHAARTAALVALRSELEPPIAPAEMALIGLPEPRLARALLDRLAGALGLHA